MVSVVPLRGLVIFLCLFLLCVEGIQDVNTVCLARMTQYFYDNVQPRTGQGADAQYALSIYVPPAHCTDKHANIENEFDKFQAAEVKRLLNKGDKCEFCTKPKNVIASRPVRIDGKTEHSEHVLLYPVGNSLMDKLLEKARDQSCVVFYSYNSPCVKTCLQSEDNILEGLRNWRNKRKDKMNAFVFQEIWQKDRDKDILQTEFQNIDAIVPLYRCMRKNNGMECRKCVKNNVVDPFCLPEKK